MLPARIAVTGAAGDLGTKLLRHLAGASADGVESLVGLDRVAPTAPAYAPLRQAAGAAGIDLELVACDLADPADDAWRRALDGVDAVVHLAARNPYPEASWEDAAVSLDMTVNVGLAAVDAGVRRVVFASSNHVMGRYKDAPWSDGIGAGQLRTDLPPGVGTVWQSGATPMDSTAYATAKLAGERLCRALALRGTTSFVCVRIGWCQPGDNRPDTLSAAGSPTLAVGGGANDDEARRDEARQDEAWFRGMWLSNGDFARLLEAALAADVTAWPARCVVVNGVSANTGMAWSLDEAAHWLEYAPRDDVARS